jgi:Reverse transcriptase (RNA-dependent DNA polymerase)
MGARKKRSTLSALSLITSSVQAAWQARPGCVVSMLSLDLSGAFDNVSHERPLWILRKKGLPDWMIKFTQAFLTGRTTKIVFEGYESELIPTPTGIPQGSPQSPILFLFFISELLETFESNQETVALGFVDDTNLITWGNTAAENCTRLNQAHDRCIAWAKRHGAKFAPDKYQLIHFTRKRRANNDLASTVSIQGCEVKPEATLKVLGVWVDAKLNWNAHITQATHRGAAAFAATSRIAASTWGPSLDAHDYYTQQ